MVPQVVRNHDIVTPPVCDPNQRSTRLDPKWLFSATSASEGS
jgi:hypothetical protein